MVSRINEGALAQLEQERDDLRKELQAAHEMLAFVLNETGEVFVPKSALVSGLPENAQIAVDDDLQRDGFVFRLETPVE